MLAQTALRALRARRVQLVAWVAPLAKVPMTMVTAAENGIGWDGTTCVRPAHPPISRVAIHIDVISSTNINGTETRDSRSMPR